MSEADPSAIDIPQSQRMIRDRCFHPSGEFIEFRKDEIEQSISDRFEQQVANHGNRLAVKTSSQELTHDELNRTANRVARAILAQRGDVEEPVALLLEQGATLIATILAALKAGKIYVPLDPNYPLARIRYALRDSHLFITGRIKEIINRGGEKVAPKEIDDLLLDHAAVEQAAAFAAPHPTLGEDIAAAVVLRTGTSATEQEIRDWTFSRRNLDPEQPIYGLQDSTEVPSRIEHMAAHYHASITGTDDTPIEEAHMQVLAEQLQACIDRTQTIV